MEIREIDAEGIKALAKNDSKKLRLVNVWATWCVPCVAEFPELVAALASQLVTPFISDWAGDLAGQVFALLRADVQPHMPVVGAQLAKVAYQFHFNIQGVAEITLWVRRLRKA